MELDKFISESLKSIISGINDAQDFAKDNGSIINPDLRKWDYDKMFSLRWRLSLALKKQLFDLMVKALITNRRQPAIFLTSSPCI